MFLETGLFLALILIIFICVISRLWTWRQQPKHKPRPTLQAAK
jgi:hypothetical protein